MAGPDGELVPQAERGEEAGARAMARGGAVSAGMPTGMPARFGDDLVGLTMSFVATFERWSGRKAAEAGASIPRMKLLYSIHCHGPRKMADLAGELDTTPRNVTAIVDSLEAEGMVRRTPHATDRRVTLIELACERDEIAEQFATFQRSVAELFAGFDDADRQALARLLAGMQLKMRPDEGRRPAND